MIHLGLLYISFLTKPEFGMSWGEWGASQKCKFIELGALNFQIPGISKMPGILYQKC
ncbi:hypothetical protein CKA32_005816 [Geitlerinema sp. FC II]|nr:hypothetical protein CKA32_005816 [Geitlerinema sp. FC II]